MTAVLSPTNAFRHDMPSLNSDDERYNTDWRQKYIELSETLAETRADLEEFQQSSKELEEEMTLEIERTERAQQEQKAKTSRAEAERDDWKSKFITLQTTHNTTTTSLQRELDTLRQQQQAYKVQMRELEMGNDDLERNERAVMSSLADVEAKYSRVLEEKILLEHELLDKANLEEESQRLKDELRDACEEVSNLKRQLEQTRALVETSSTSPAQEEMGHNDKPPFPITPRRSFDEELLKTPAPTELLLSDLTPDPVNENIPRRRSITPLPPPSTSLRAAAKPELAKSRSALPSRAGSTSNPTSAIPLASSTPSSLPRSSTLPSLSPARTTNHTAHGQTFGQYSARSVTSGLPTIPGTASKSRGVQMISALRSRVQTTQQRLIPGIPRLRMGSVTSRTGPTVQSTPAVSSNRNGASQNDRYAGKSGNHPADERSKRHSNGKQRDDSEESRPGAQSPGWVLIQTQDDSPMPTGKKEPLKDRRRASSPLSMAGSHVPIPSAYKPLTSTSTAPPGASRPQSRLSLTADGGGSAPPTGGGFFTSNSIPALSSRPATPTFLPVPTANYHGGNKRSSDSTLAAFSASSYNPRRSSLGTQPSKRSVSPGPAQPAIPVSSYSMYASTRERPTSAASVPRTSFGSSLAVTNNKNGALKQSRIGKPAGNRRSADGAADDTLAIPNVEQREKGRLRSGSTTNLWGRQEP